MDSGTIEGRVVEAGHRSAVGGAVVAAWSQGQMRIQALSDESGTFHLEGLRPGRYEIRADRPGYRLARQSAQVKAGQTATVKVALAEWRFPDQD